MIGLILTLVLAALLLWVIGQFPLDPTIVKIIRVVVIVLCVIICINFLLPLFGNLNGWPSLNRK